MTEFYKNLSSEDIDNIISKKLELYGPDFEFYRLDSVIVAHENFIYRAYANYHSLKIGSFDMYIFKGNRDGIELYRFYNCIDNYL